MWKRMGPTWAVWSFGCSGQESRGNSQPPRAALSGVYRSGQYGGPGAAVSSHRDRHSCAVRSDLATASGLDFIFKSEQKSFV